MGFNYGYEKKKFDSRWKRLEVEYCDAGMSEEQIAAMKEYDWAWFCSQRVFQNHTQPIPCEQYDEVCGQSQLFRKFASLSYQWDVDKIDHYSEEDIDKVINENTTIIIPEELLTKLLRKGINKNAIITVEPNKEYVVKGIKFKTIPAYNTNKTFHPKGNDWVGYIITINNIRYYIAGDTDITEENKKVKCDVAFVPVGGTYTMDFKEAAQLINEIQPKMAIPIHYGSVVGTNQDATDFVKLLHPSIKGIILMKQ